MKKKARKHRGKMNINRKNGATGTVHAKSSLVGSLPEFSRGKGTEKGACGTFVAQKSAAQKYIDECYREFIALQQGRQ